MPQAISNTSPLLYLYRIGAMDWLSHLFDKVKIPTAVIDELQEGLRKGYDVPNPSVYPWLRMENPHTMQSEWLALELGPGELAAMALALENPSHIILLDDLLARRTAQAAGLTVWGTLKVLLEAKKQGVTNRIEPFVTLLDSTGMWISEELRQRILILAGEESTK